MKKPIKQIEILLYLSCVFNLITFFGTNRILIAVSMGISVICILSSLIIAIIWRLQQNKHEVELFKRNNTDK